MATSFVGTPRLRTDSHRAPPSSSSPSSSALRIRELEWRRGRFRRRGRQRILGDSRGRPRFRRRCTQPRAAAAEKQQRPPQQWRLVIRWWERRRLVVILEALDPFAFDTAVPTSGQRSLVTFRASRERARNCAFTHRGAGIAFCPAIGSERHAMKNARVLALCFSFTLPYDRPPLRTDAGTPARAMTSISTPMRSGWIRTDSGRPVELGKHFSFSIETLARAPSHSRRSSARNAPRGTKEPKLGDLDDVHERGRCRARRSRADSTAPHRIDSIKAR